MSIIHSHFLGLVMKSVQERHRENERQWRSWELSSEPSQMPQQKSHGFSTYSGTALVSRLFMNLYCCKTAGRSF
jgi:hypothetical protein